MIEEVPRWERGHRLLQLGVADIDRTRQLKADLEVLPGVRRDDPARDIIWQHARTLSDELVSVRTLRDELREAHRSDQ